MTLLNIIIISLLMFACLRRFFAASFIGEEKWRTEIVNPKSLARLIVFNFSPWRGDSILVFAKKCHISLRVLFPRAHFPLKAP